MTGWRGPDRMSDWTRDDWTELYAGLAEQPCCPAIYVCPSSGEPECLTHGGFDSCCADRSCPGWRRLPWWRWLRPRVLKSLAVMAGYWIRPYDMVADRRRWRWQRRAQCGFAWARANPEAAQRLAAAIERATDEEESGG